ncbi:sensor histidine kinase [Algoriphagus hitonicola]|uniref:histidine kinase n=1 Tax=Algoriphagus hitonicola TaxID=435880 RepID=A0A1I2Q5I0_9BACT|nr:two-component regulator propeller domain-containing protein [Algoriphagus hitonicola]SFG21507.1 Two component regulator propeller [Algoriphagus hitonicola]
MFAVRNPNRYWFKAYPINFKPSTLVIFSFLVFFAACQGAIEQASVSNIEPTHTLLPTTIFLDSLSDSIQPIKKFISEYKPPLTKFIPHHLGETGDINQSLLVHPKPIHRPILKNNNEPVLDRAGNYYYLGDGGISHFTTLTSDDGLALDNITSSLLDQSGNLWFGTWGAGISKFDGTSFTNFSTAHGLSNNLVHCLAEDLNGNLWIGTEGGGISIYDGYSFTTLSQSDGLVNDVIYGIYHDSKGNTWIAGGNKGATKFDGESFTSFNKETGLSANSIIKIIEDKHGFIWFGTGNNGTFRFDGKDFIHFTIEDGLASNTILSISKDKAGNLWFGTDGGGISKYSQGTNLNQKGEFTSYTLADGLGNNQVWDIKEDLQGNIWLATGGGGVSKFDGEIFTNYTSSQGLAEDVVYTITTDKSDNKWIGTAGGGLVLFKGNAFTNFTPDLGIALNGVFGIQEDDKGNLWFGTNGEGITKYDGKSFTNFGTDQGLPHPLVISVFKDKEGKLWIGTGGGGLTLYREGLDDRSTASFTTFNKSNGMANDVIYAITEDSEGNLWIGTGGGGLVKFDWNITPNLEAGFTNYTTDQGLASNQVYSLLEDRNGKLWIGTGGGGVSRFDGKSFTNFTTAQGLANDIIWSILEDRRGNLWFASQGGGVSKFDGNSFSSFTTREGLGDDTVYDLLEDMDGNIFIGTNKGYTVIPAGFTSTPFDELRDNLEYYNTTNGYPVKDVNKGIYQDSQGNIWAGNGSDKTGLVKMRYQSLRKKKVKPIVRIKNITINENPVSWLSLKDSSDRDSSIQYPKNLYFTADEVRVFGRRLGYEERESKKKEFSNIQFSDVNRFENFPNKLTLPYSQNQITIDFGTDELVRPGLMEYRYILEGYNTSWSPVIRKSDATFGNIREGEYVFRVISRFTGPSEGEGKEWSDEAVYRFTVLPPLHRTWWAYLIYVIILLFGIKRVHVFQKSSALRKERERIQQKELDQAKEIEKAYRELKAAQAQLIQSEKMASLGELTAGIAHEIQNPLNFVNNFSELNKDLIQEIEEERAKNQEERDEILINEILKDIKENESKINHHGKRADSIVKGMLQHSRSGSGEKVPTNINTLADEYLRLSYHGMRAKDKSFQADFKTDFDPNLPKVNVVPQDIGRVLLNLINNAFQACAQRDLSGFENLTGLQPLVTLSTKNLGDKIQISVKDNGSGIPEDLKEKIFQPFFTTKPSGQGTGLGLSLSYDIVKAHGGALEVQSEPGNTVFRITFPI